MAKAYWFFLFHLVPDLPEALIAGKEEVWLRYFFSDWCFDPTTISGEAFDTYVRAYKAPGHLPQEEQPEVVNGLLLKFLEGWHG